MTGSMTTPSRLCTRVYRAQSCCLALDIKRRHSEYVHFVAQWLRPHSLSGYDQLIGDQGDANE